MDKTNSGIADRIDAGCLALGYSQVQLAELAKLPTRQLLNQIKSGERPGRKWLPGLAKALKTSVEWLTTGTGDPPSWALRDAMAAVLAQLPPDLQRKAKLDPLTVAGPMPAGSTIEQQRFWYAQALLVNHQRQALRVADKSGGYDAELVTLTDVMALLKKIDGRLAVVERELKK